MFFESCTNTSPVYVNQYKVPKYLLKEVLLTTMHQYIYISGQGKLIIVMPMQVVCMEPV